MSRVRGGGWGALTAIGLGVLFLGVRVLFASERAHGRLESPASEASSSPTWRPTRELAADRRAERRLLAFEALILLVIGVLIALRVTYVHGSQ